MGKLYVANCTDQVQAVCYRPDFNNPNAMFRQQEIPAGQQRIIYGDMDVSTIETITKQLCRYGLRGAVEIARLPAKHVPYVFSIDKPVSARAIETVRAHNQGVLKHQGSDRRKAAAIAASSFVDTGKFEVAYEQTEVSEMGESAIEEGYRVDKTAAPEPGNPSRRRPRKAG